MDHMTYSGNSCIAPYHVPVVLTAEGRRLAMLVRVDGAVARLVRCILGQARVISSGRVARAVRLRKGYE
eukprot:8695255-Lingulodinium_polyedra.AAC.1